MIGIDVIWILCSIVPQSDWTHSEQVWVVGDKTHWNDEMTPMLVNTPPGIICIDVMSTLFNISLQSDWIHSVQVWVSGYELHWNNQMTPKCLLMNTHRI